MQTYLRASSYITLDYIALHYVDYIHSVFAIIAKVSSPKRTCIHAYIHTYIHTCIHTYAHAYTKRTRTQASEQASKQASKQSAKYTYIHAYTHKFTHKQTQASTQTDKHMNITLIIAYLHLHTVRQPSCPHACPTFADAHTHTHTYCAAPESQ